MRGLKIRIADAESQEKNLFSKCDYTILTRSDDILEGKSGLRPRLAGEMSE